MKTTRVRCPFCGNKSAFRAYPATKLKGLFFYDKCDICGGGVLRPSPGLSTTKEIYRGSSYFDGLSAPVKNRVVQWILTKKIYKTPGEWVAAKFSKGRVLDVGCGNGEFLDLLNREGWEGWGSDISRDAVKRTSIRIGNSKRVKLGDLTKQKFSKKFDLVSFWHVLEHVRNPNNYLLKAKRLLRKGGRVVGEMPNYGSIAFKLFGKDYAWVMIPDHTLYFGENTLETVLKRNGFRNVEISNPSRALTNLSISFRKYLLRRGYPSILTSIVFIMSIPVSIVCVIVWSLFKKGEILRFVAQK